MRGQQGITAWNMLYESLFLSPRIFPVGTDILGEVLWVNVPPGKLLGDTCFQHNFRSVLPLPTFVTLKRFIHLKQFFKKLNILKITRAWDTVKSISKETRKRWISEKKK